MFRKLILLSLFLCPCMLFAQMSLKQLFDAGQQAKSEKNYPEFLHFTKEAMKLHPSHPVLLHNLAVGYALNNKPDSAFSIIKRNISYRADYPFKEEPSFETLKKSDAYGSLQLLADSLARSFSTSDVHHKIDLTTIHAEDLVILGSDIFLTDVNGGKLVKINKKGQLQELAQLSASVMAVVADNEDNLWITTSMMPQYKNYDSTRHYETKVHLYDQKQKKITHEITLKGEHVLGAGCADANGDIYFTDSTKPKIYKLDPVSYKLEEFMLLDDAFNLQGITYDISDNIIYVADYIKGIVKIDLKSGTKRWLNSNDFLLKGIDGLIKMNNGLVAIQNGSAEKRLLFLELNNQGISNIQLIDNNMKYVGEPTNGKATGNTLFYIANSPWPLYDDQYKAIMSKWEPLEIRKWRNPEVD